MTARINTTPAHAAKMMKKVSSFSSSSSLTSFSGSGLDGLTEPPVLLPGSVGSVGSVGLVGSVGSVGVLGSAEQSMSYVMIPRDSMWSAFAKPWKPIKLPTPLLSN